MTDDSRPHVKWPWPTQPASALWGATILLLALLTVGCGSESGPRRFAVSGTVTRNGKKIERGSISFLPAKGHKGPAANGVISGGEYSFTTENGPAAGPHRVLVRVPPPTKGQLAERKTPDSEAQPTDSAGGKARTAGRTRWEFEVSVSEESSQQNFQLE